MIINRIIVVGCGGIGSHFLPVFTRFINSLEEENKPEQIVLVDGDSYDIGNLNRQEFHPKLTGVNKADAQALALSQKYPELKFLSTPEYIGEGNISDIITDNSAVFLGVDNHVARRIISQHCQTLDNVIMITGSNELTDGNVQAFVRANGESLSPLIEERHPEILTTEDGDRSSMSCEELEKLPSGGQVIFANQMAATLMCQFFWNIVINDIIDAQEVYFDINQMKTRVVLNPRNKND